jgi:hypothetical protein
MQLYTSKIQDGEEMLESNARNSSLNAREDLVFGYSNIYKEN